MNLPVFYLLIWIGIRRSLVVAFVPSCPTATGTSTRSSALDNPHSCLYSSTDDYNFMASLQKRMDQVMERDTTLPLVVLDAMLPRQVLNITVKNGLLMELVRQRLQEETPSFGMVGHAKLANGKQVTLSSGVEVEIVGNPKVTDEGLHLSLKGTRRFRIFDKEQIETTPSGWTQAKVQFLNSTQEDRADDTDTMSMARAMQMAREFSEPNLAMEEQQSLVEMWLELARTRERRPNQIDQLLQDLGPMPSWKDPSECAFWVGALINPIPAMGVAFEIRPKLLLAKTAEERTQIALDAIWNSIQHMQGADRFEQRKGW
ncbi:ATP-dependent protease La (LON) domain [Seminavis robusta]|uniref:ATP-dependent protease La (LON) domain n=1 Tax=Seminavis robusta TaxID=568900 RepID=A0A9N8DV78_9STRA|nr:ATP-dependent protease La (LON) domain [Seminavis robusta]|eukprot:Sro376_g129820.1 ATP-dependent protease La (LON) domain (316) ;mRNA; r:57565-58512